MQTKRIIQLVCIALAVCLTMGVLCACGVKTVALTVNDSGTSSQIEASTDMTVADALDKAGVTLGEKDETDPAKDSKITEDLKEITVKRYAEVTVVYNGEEKKVALTGGTVEDAVKESGFTVSDDIKPDAPLTDYLKDGMTINLVKGVKVTLTVDGKTEDVTTYMSTVEDLLKEQNITLGDDDEVSEKLTAKPAEGMKITVTRVTYEEVKETEKIDYETEESYSDSMDEGTSEVSQEGAEGEKEVTYKVKYVDGKEDSREMVSETVTKEPVKKIVTYGSRSTGGSGDSGNSGNSGNSGDSGEGSGGRTVVDKTDVPDCDGSGHGYYIITYSDGTQEYEDY